MGEKMSAKAKQQKGINTAKGSQQKTQHELDQEALNQRMGEIRHKIIILSGKGGVGKSTVAANLAIALALEGHQVGLLDVDFHGPSIPKLLGIEDRVPQIGQNTIVPIQLSANLKVMSMGFLLRAQDLAVIWRGPLKMGAIKQFLKDVEWGNLDYLIIDSPPGTGDEPLSVAQLIPNLDGAIVVTSPQDLSVIDVRKSITFCRQLNIPVLGVIENMSGLICPHCGQEIEVFKKGGGERMAMEMNVPFLGSIPIDPQVVEASDQGVPFVAEYSETKAAKAFEGVVRVLLSGLGATEEESVPPGAKGREKTSKERAASALKIAIPVAQGKLAAHFGHSDQFALVQVEGGQIKKTTMATPPPHEPGVLPKWLHEQAAQVIIAGGMGRRAQDHFENQGIKVVIGAPSLSPEELVRHYLDGTLETGENICDH
jgi:ATP-binding protein involved in chromosome partitioning